MHTWVPCYRCITRRLSTAACRHMEELFNKFVHIAWWPRAETRLTAALLEVGRDMTALGPAPESLKPKDVWEAVLKRVNQDAIFEEIHNQVEVLPQPQGLVCAGQRR